jgi:hypothetical protein
MEIIIGLVIFFVILTILIFSLANIRNINLFGKEDIIENLNSNSISPELYTAFKKTIELNDGSSGILSVNILDNLKILNNLEGSTYYSSIQEYINNSEIPSNTVRFENFEDTTKTNQDTQTIDKVNSVLANTEIKQNNFNRTSTSIIHVPFITNNLQNQGTYNIFQDITASYNKSSEVIVNKANKFGMNYQTITIKNMGSSFTKEKKGYTISCWFYLPRNDNVDWNTTPLQVCDRNNSLIFSWNPCNAPWNRSYAGLYYLVNGNYNVINARYTPDNTWQQIVITVSSEKKLTYYLNSYFVGDDVISNALDLNYIYINNYETQWGNKNQTPYRLFCVFDSEFDKYTVSKLYSEQQNM